MTLITTNITSIARDFHALSDETRLEIVEMLRSGELCVCELMDAISCAQSRLSFHLKVLRDAGVVLDRKQGRWVYYKLNPEFFERIQAYSVSHLLSGELPVNTHLMRIL